VRHMGLSTGVALWLVCSAASGQAQSLSITSFQQVSQQSATPPYIEVTYRANIVDTGAAVAGVAASVTSLNPYNLRVVPGAGTLEFAAVPANGTATSSNTVTFLVNQSAPVDFSQLQWTFQTLPVPVANAGPNQTVSVGQLVVLNGSGSTNPTGAGPLTYSWKFSSLPAGSRAFLGYSTTAFPTFLVDLPGSYVAQLTVSNGVASSSATVTISTGRTPPVANAGPNQTVAVGATVHLNGSGSTSAAGLPLTYAWTLIARPAGSAAALAGGNTVSPTFVIDKVGAYEAQLIVNDGLASSPSTVTIATQTIAPVANAGPNQVVRVGALVQLSGAGSTDANGLPLTYLWSLVSIPSGSAASLSNPTAVNPTFTVDRTGSYVTQLIVNNGRLSSQPATATITTQTLLAPTANAGQNHTVAQGSLVTLSGSGTDPQNLPLAFQWSLVSKPANSSAALSSATIASPTFVADQSGTYVAQLIVSDGLLSSAPSTVMISTGCSQPTANPGTNQNVTVGLTVQLNGTGSGDACHDPLTYAWTFTARPSGSSATLSASNTATPSFVADVAGVYVAQLIVNNGVTASTPATLTVTASSVQPPPPTGPVGGVGILLPASVTVGLNLSSPFPVTLSTGAPSGAIFITLTSSDPSKVVVAPGAFIIPQGATAPNVVPTVTGIAPGSATVTAAAYGLASASRVVQVTSGSAPGPGPGTGTAMSFTPASLMINGTATQNLTLLLPAVAPPGGLAVQLSSSNPAAASVPSTVNIASGTASALVPVTGVSPGAATITASAANYQSAAALVNVFSTQNVSVTWYGACWVTGTIEGNTGNFQAIDFSMVTPAPTTFQGTLFFTPNCDPSGGADNLNDTGALTGTTHMVQGFTHHPDLIPSSAVYWVGPRTANGMCAPGSPCSGCVTYTATTPNCTVLP
jgi:PKD domain